MLKNALLGLALLVILFLSGFHGSVAKDASIFKELLENSMNDKKGIAVFVRGQTVSGVVTKINGHESIELRNQTYGKILIKVSEIDAVAMS